jgi:hypothetical protein
MTLETRFHRKSNNSIAAFYRAARHLARAVRTRPSFPAYFQDRAHVIAGHYSDRLLTAATTSTTVESAFY